MAISRIRNPTIFPPIGQCVYCLKRSDLGDEHIIARSLNGSMILPRASCKACGDVTSRFERTCARTIFGPLRIRHEMRTRRKKERPSAIEIEARSSDGGLKTNLVPASEIPDVVFLLKFGHVANILLAAPDIDTSQVKPWIAGTLVLFPAGPGGLLAGLTRLRSRECLQKLATA
jgi:hypothetical protein